MQTKVIQIISALSAMAALGQACEAEWNTLQVFATSNCEEKEGYKWTYTLGDPDSIG